MFNSAIAEGKSNPARMPWLQSAIGWLRSHERTVLLAGILFQIAVLLVMISSPLMTVITGDTVLLRVRPVDPRDLFRGDYVILSYDFASVPVTQIPGFPANDMRGTVVYLTLAREDDGKHWRADRYSLTKPNQGRFLRGRVKRANRLEFGIESFFVQEGEGLMYERAVRSGRLSAEVSLDSDGQAVLKRLVID